MLFSKIDISLINLILTLISALLGGFIGAYFTKQNQHHKWLLERQAEAFSKFLQLLDEAHFKATDFLHDRQLANTEREIKILEAYQQVFIQAKIVRLYLLPEHRVPFTNFTKEYWTRHASRDLVDNRLAAMSKILDQIQTIFESELRRSRWL